MMVLAECTLRSGLDADAAIALLKDVVSGSDCGLALLDEELNFVLFNEKFSDLVTAGKGFPQVGEKPDKLRFDALSFEGYEIPGAMTEAEFAADLQTAIASCSQDKKLSLKDGRLFQLSSKRTQLGGHLVSATDVSAHVAPEVAEHARWDAVSEIVDALDEGLSLWDSDMRFIMCNDRYLKDAAPHRTTPFPKGMRGEDAIAEGIRAGDFKVPDSVTEQELIATFMQWAHACAGSMEVEQSDGRIVVATAKQTKLGGVLITTQDITETRDTEARSQNMLREAVDALDDGIMLFDKDLRLEVFNTRAAEFFQRNGKNFQRGEAFLDIWRGLALDRVWVLEEGVGPEERARLAVENVRNYAKYREIRLADGRELLASSHKTDQGGYLLVYRDKTEQARVENLLADVIENLPVGVAVEDAEHRLTHCNDAFSLFYGIPEDELRSLTRSERIERLYDKLAKVNDVPLKAPPNSSWGDGQDFAPVEMKFTDGRHVFAERATTKRGETILVMTDTTLLKKAQEEHLSSINDAIEATGEALVLYDKGKNYVLSNQAWLDLFWAGLPAPNSGAPASSLFQRLWDTNYFLIPEGLTKQEFFTAAMEVVDTYGKNFPMETSDGRFLLASSHKTDLGGYLLSFRDITDERKSEARAQDMLQDAFQALDEGLVLCDANMNYVFGNDAWKKMNFEGAEHMIPEPGDSVVENLAAMIAAGHYDTGGMSNDDYMQWMMSEMSQHGKRAHVKFVNGRHILGSSHLTAYGGALLFVRDITEQQKLEVELEQQREIAHQNEKLSALGELLAGVAHELNNPLSVVFGYSQMLQGKINDPVLSERVDLICQSSERAAKIVRTFLAMARQRPTRMEPCSVNEVVETALEVSSYSLKSNGTDVVVDLDGSDPHVTGDFDQLAQVFSNLIVNAGHAVRDKGSRGRIVVRTRREGGQVQIDISDNGNGIPKDIQPRIFEPFFTTRDVGKGTGIGLAFGHRIVESHDGTLTVASTVGHGATFTVRLLAAESDGVLAVRPDASPASNRSVLVVDDEDGVARLITDLLTDAGYSVTTSTDPTAALKLAEARQFDAVLSDFKMPQMSGDTFFRAMRAVAPENASRTGFVTGDAMSAQVATFLKTSQRPHIEKPIMKDELLSLLASLIGDTRP